MRPLVLLFGPTASGKSSLALALAQRFGAEILSCDSVAVYRAMELGTAKPSAEERALVRHHLLDLYDPNETCTAGDYARAGRAVLGELAGRGVLPGVLPIVSGGTGLYARALIDGLSPAPGRNAALREALARRVAVRGAAHLHRTLGRLDGVAAVRIHPNDVPKVMRAIEVSVALRRPITEQWMQLGRERLEGYRVLRLGLDPPRAELYGRIDARAAAMFARGLVEETAGLIARFGPECAPFSALGYAEAGAVLRGELTEAAAVARAQQGHRNYAKRQMTWFRREGELHATEWLRGVGDSAGIVERAVEVVEGFLGA